MEEYICKRCDGTGLTDSYSFYGECLNKLTGSIIQCGCVRDDYNGCESAKSNFQKLKCEVVKRKTPCIRCVGSGKISWIERVFEKGT